MKSTTLTVIIITLFFSYSFSQMNRQLTLQEVKSLKEKIGNIPFPVYKAFEYKDNSGTYYLFLCERQDNIVGKDTFNTGIKAICYLHDHDNYMMKWEIADLLEQFLNKTKEEEDVDETNIWFWTKYCTFVDIDGDKLIEPVIVYGTSIPSGFRRIKIITVYKGKKYAIRAVECELDYCRSLKKDKDFAQLPTKVKVYLEELLERIRTEQNVILKDG